MFKVDRDIPLPPEVLENVGKRKYPWYELAVGESFWVRGRTPAQMAACYAQVQRKTTMRFTARRSGPGTRCWRIISLVGATGLAIAFVSEYGHWAFTKLFLPAMFGLA